MISYCDAKAALFAEVGFSEKFMSEWMPRLADGICSLIAGEYLDRQVSKDVQVPLKDAMGQFKRAAELARILGCVELAGKNESRAQKLADMLIEVTKDHARASISAKVLSGGDRYEKHFLGKKLRMDAMIVAVDGFVQEMNRQGITKRKRPTYQGAALLHYLGFEKVFRYLSRNSPFPAKLKEEDDIHREYRTRRKEAMRYLAPDRVRQLVEETYARLTEHEVNRAKTEAIISEVLRERLSR